MNSHLNIKLRGQDVNLTDDFSMNFHDQNPIFNSNEMWSEPAPIDIATNRHLMENVDQPNSGHRAVDFDKMSADVEVDGVPVRHGWARVQDGTLIDESLDVNIDASAQSFDDLIGDLECRDVPLKDRIKIGEKIGNVHVDVEYLYQASITYNEDSKKGGQTKTYMGISPKQASGDFEPQALGFSQPGVTSPAGSVNGITVDTHPRTYPDGHQVNQPRFDVDYINVSEEYGSMVNSPYHDGQGNVLGWPFCNARIAYPHHMKDDTTVPPSTSDKIDTSTTDNVYECMNPYWVLDARRPQSGICFYVLYFLDCLFEHLGVTFDNSELMKIADLKRLAFFTTHCKYDSEYEGGRTFSGMLDNITTTERGTIRDYLNLLPEPTSFIENYTEQEYNNTVFRDVNAWLDERGCGGLLWVFKPVTKSVQNCMYTDRNGNRVKVVVGKEQVAAVEYDARIKKISYTARVMSMYANSDNFPEASVKDVIDSLEASFGIRFAYDYKRRHVKAYLLRDIFRSSSPQVRLNGEILSVTPKADLTSGVRMKYSNEGTDKEQRLNVKRGIRDYDTDYDYIEYPQNRTVINLTFDEIRQRVSSNNMYVYIDQQTGNAYRVKVEKETLGKPVLFEVGQFKGIEVGDCSKENEDYIVEYISSFVPVPFNRVSALQEQALASGNDEMVFSTGDKIGSVNKELKPTYAAFADVDMEHEFITQRIDNVLDNQFVDVSCSEVLELIESYNPSQTDDGNSPLQSYDWGMAVAIMRGGGTNMTIQHYDYGFDGFRNSKWKTIAGDYAMSSDSITPDGEDYDYNGTEAGDGGGERLSLKIRAYKQPAWADGPLCVTDVMDGTDPTKIDRRIRTRGLADTMMAEIIHFHLHKKPLEIKMLMTAAELAAIPTLWDKRVQIGDMIGLIGSVDWSAHVTNGLSPVTIEFYYI